MTSSPLEAAAARVDFRLTYAKTSEPRSCIGFGIEGPDIPNAYYGVEGAASASQETSSGEWYDLAHPPQSAKEEDHIKAWFGSAVREAIHEALEWFKVDGAPLIDPHGRHEGAVNELSSSLVKELLWLIQEPSND